MRASRFYPDVPSRRAKAVLADALVLALLAAFGWLGYAVHGAVEELAVLGQGVHEAGTAVEGGFGRAADAVDAAPLVGERLAEGLRDAGRQTGGDVAVLGRTGEDRVHRLADVLGLLTFAVPAGLVLAQAVPKRISDIRRLTAARRVLADPDSVERRMLLAMRAVFSLPYGQLLRHTADPLGDLAGERYDGLVAAALEDAGLRLRHRTRTPRRG